VAQSFTQTERSVSAWTRRVSGCHVELKKGILDITVLSHALGVKTKNKCFVIDLIDNGPVGRSSMNSKFLFCQVVKGDLNIMFSKLQVFWSIRLGDRDYLNTIFQTKKVDAFSSKFF